MPPAAFTDAWLARLVRSHTPVAWTFSQIWMQRRHLMHLSLLRMSGKAGSERNPSRCLGYGRSVIPRSFARLCSEQLPERAQLVHSESCCESRNSTFALRAMRALRLFVRTTMPSST